MSVLIKGLFSNHQGIGSDLEAQFQDCVYESDYLR